MQITRVRAANGYHWTKIQDNHINVNSLLYDPLVGNKNSTFVQDRYFQLLVFGNNILLGGEGEEVERYIAF